MQAHRAYRYWLDLARKHTDELGFLPAPSVGRLIDAGRLILELENDEPCGFLLHGPPGRVLRVYQTCVQVDARRISHALAMVAALRTRAVDGGSRAIVLHCAADLDANAFWSAAGFERVGTRVKSTRRDRQQIKWLLPLCDIPPGTTLAELDVRQKTRPRREWSPEATSFKAKLGNFLAFTPGAR